MGAGEPRTVQHDAGADRGPELEEGESALRGEAKYLACVDVARRWGVRTPEDEFVAWEWEGEEEKEEDDNDGDDANVGELVEDAQTPSRKRKRRHRVLICPIFTLYDYSFRPAHVPRSEALDWALEDGIRATDEALLHPDPYASRDEWCARLVTKSHHRLTAALASEPASTQTVLINHWPLRQDLVHIPLVPRFSIWCGTKATEDWHVVFRARVVVTGHLHVRRTDWKARTRFEEVSLGYPKQWEGKREEFGGESGGLEACLREVLPGSRVEPGRDGAGKGRPSGGGSWSVLERACGDVHFLARLHFDM